MGRLDGKVVIVTGAVGGIGSGIVRRCCDEGASVLASDIDEDALGALSKEAGARCAVVACDLADPASPTTIVAAAVEQFATVDVLVNNAYWNPGYESAEEVTLDGFDRCYRVGPLATFLLSQGVFPYMRDTGRGRIINFGSEMSDQPLPGRTPYASAKGMIRGMTKAMARDWGRYGVTVNTVWPSSASPSWDRYVEANPEIKEKILSEMALGRVGDAYHDVAPVVVFLASDESGWITGQTLTPNGGRTML